MSKIKGLKLDNSSFKVSQEINFDELTDVDLTDEVALKREIAQAIIDRMVERTERGESAYGGSLGTYSKEYQNSLDFKAFGKSNPVDLKLTGDMLNSVDIIEESGNKITIGFNDDLENAKAYGHQTGMKGSKDPNRLRKPRPFFGVGYDEIKKDILSNFRSDLMAIKKEAVLRERDDALLEAQDVLRRIINEEEDADQV